MLLGHLCIRSPNAGVQIPASGPSTSILCAQGEGEEERSIPVQLEEPRSEGTVLWEFISIDSFLGTSLRMWLLCADVISYKGGNGSHSLGRYEQKQLFTSPQARAAGHGGFPTLSCIL